MPFRLVLATHNAGKIRELKEILSELPIELASLADLALAEETEETGDTYAANALLKATAICQLTGQPTLGDDSGLEVDALGGRPGVHTARYAGPAATNPDRWAKVLAELRETPPPERTARFKCAMALVRPGVPPQVVEGVCEGMIALAPSGAGGFGYDPIFYLPEYACTMAELNQKIKNQVSHRARAAQKAKGVILAWISSSMD
ncbi:MAG: XTP/dITP diphosphatase [Chloroflexota bacterium]